MYIYVQMDPGPFGLKVSAILEGEGKRSVFWANKPKLISVVPNPLSSLNSNQVDGPSVVVKTQLNATIKCGHPELTQPVGQVFRARGAWVPCIGLALGRLGKARAPTTQRRSC